MDTEREKWVSRILESAEEIKGFRAPEDLFPQIMETVQNEGSDVIKLPLRQIRIALAAACALVILNAGILLLARRNAPAESSSYIESYDLNLYK